MKKYLQLEKPILYLIGAEFLIQFVNCSFITLQVIFMQVNGYTDAAAAGFIAIRFLGVVIFAVPLGMYIKSKKLHHLFYIGAVGVPLFGFFIILNTVSHSILWLYVSQFLWGVSFTFIQIPIIPYILRNVNEDLKTEGISLSYSTYSFAGIISGILIYVLNSYYPTIFNEKNILLLVVILGFLAPILVFKSKAIELIPEIKDRVVNFKEYDWKLIIKALVPTLIIAVGAGLTIPFISIFFYNVHHVSTNNFGIVSALASVLVAGGALYVPSIKRIVGYKIAIPTTQSFAVIALVLLATTQFYAQLSIAVYIAFACYLLRQPLMNLAGPMTTELVMNYVGKRNQEMVSGLIAAIWSGSWFISSLIYQQLRSSGLDYVYVFLITALLYGIGVIWYYVLILDYHKREQIKEVNP